MIRYSGGLGSTPESGAAASDPGLISPTSPEGGDAKSKAFCCVSPPIAPIRDKPSTKLLPVRGLKAEETDPGKIAVVKKELSPKLRRDKKPNPEPPIKTDKLAKLEKIHSLSDLREKTRMLKSTRLGIKDPRYGKCKFI